MALFMVANNLTPEDVLDTNREHAFPASVVDLLGGMMGQPVGGFPEEVQRIVLKGESPLTDRPGKSLPSVDFEDAAVKVKKMLGREPKPREVSSYVLYPRVFEDFAKHVVAYTDTSVLPTPVFFYGLSHGEEIAVEIERGKTLIIKFLTMGDPTPEGMRTVFFELNGFPREVIVEDRALESSVSKREKADVDNDKQVGSSMPGMVVNVAVASGAKVKKGDKLLVLEAMKMETTLYAEYDGTVARVLVAAGSQVEAGDLLVSFE